MNQTDKTDRLKLLVLDEWGGGVRGARVGRGRTRGPKFEVFGTSNPELRTSSHTFPSSLACLVSETSRSSLCSDIPLDGKFLGMAAGLCHIVSKLHPKKMVHVGAERFLNAEGHFRG